MAMAAPTGILEPTLPLTLRNIPARALPWAGLGAVQGTVEAGAEPGATPRSVLLGGATGAVTQGAVGAGLDVAGLGLRRLLRTPAGLVRRGAGADPAVRAEAAKVLGVTRTATDEQVRSAYRVLARRYHPDVNPDPGAPRIMATINDAYNVLVRGRPSPMLLYGGLPLPPWEIMRPAIARAGRAARIEAAKIAQVLASVQGGETLAKALVGAGLDAAAQRLFKQALSREIIPIPKPVEAAPPRAPAGPPPRAVQPTKAVEPKGTVGGGPAAAGEPDPLAGLSEELRALHNSPVRRLGFEVASDRQVERYLDGLRSLAVQRKRPDIVKLVDQAERNFLEGGYAWATEASEGALGYLHMEERAEVQALADEMDRLKGLPDELAPLAAPGATPARAAAARIPVAAGPIPPPTGRAALPALPTAPRTAADEGTVAELARIRQEIETKRLPAKVNGTQTDADGRPAFTWVTPTEGRASSFSVKPGQSVEEALRKKMAEMRAAPPPPARQEIGQGRAVRPLDATVRGRTPGGAAPVSPPSGSRFPVPGSRLLDALTPLERDELALLGPSIRRTFHFEGPVSLDAHAQLARYGSLLFRAGYRTYGPWAREMLRGLGRAIKRFLSKVWAKVKKFHREETGMAGRQPEPGSPRKFFQIARGAGLSKPERTRLWEAMREAHPSSTPEGLAFLADAPPAKVARALEEWRTHLETWKLAEREREASRTGATHLTEVQSSKFKVASEGEAARQGAERRQAIREELSAEWIAAEEQRAAGAPGQGLAEAQLNEGVKPPYKPPVEAPPAAVPAPEEPGKPTALFVRTEPGPFGDLPVWKLEGGPRAGEEFACLPSQIEDMGYEIAGGPLTDNAKPGTGNRERGTGAEAGKAAELLPDEARVLEFLTTEPVTMDTLIQKSGLPAHKVSGALTMLELKGRVRPVAGSSFIRIEGEGAAAAEAPVYVLEGKRVRRLLEDATPAGVARAAKVMRISDQEGVQSALWRLSITSRARADFEGAGRKMVPEQHEAYTPLLEWLRGTKINAWKGAPEEAEMAEAVAGRAALRKFFDFKTPKKGSKPTGGYIDQVVEDAKADPVSGFKGDTTRELLDAMTREADLLEAGGKKSLAELLDAGDAKARAMADSIRGAILDEDEARTAAIDAIMPHVTSGRTGISEAELRRAVRGAETRAVEAEAVATEAKAQAAKAVAARDKIVALLDEYRAGRIDDVELRKAVIDTANAVLPPEKRFKVLTGALAKPMTEKRVAEILARIRSVQEHWERTEAAEDVQRIAKIIVRHEREFDTTEDPSLEKIIQRAKEMAGMTQARLANQHDLDALKNLSEDLTIAWHEHQTRGWLLTERNQISVQEVAGNVVGDAKARGAPTPVEGRGGQPETPRRPMYKAPVDLSSKVFRLVEALMGPEDGPASRYLVQDVGINAAPGYYREVNRIYENLGRWAEEACGGDAESEKFVAWLTATVTEKMPDGQTVTAERDFWNHLRAFIHDEDALRRAFVWIDKKTGVEAEHAVQFVWETRKGRVAFEVPNRAKARSWAAGYDQREPEAARYVTRILEDLNRPERFKTLDAIHFTRYGLHLVRVPGTRCPTFYNLRVEKPLRSADFMADLALDIERRYGHHRGRLPPGRTSSVILKRLTSIYSQEIAEDAAFANYLLPIRNARVLLGTPVAAEPGHKAITLEAWLAERLGEQIPSYLRSHLLHIARTVRLAPSLMQDQSAPERMSRRLLRNTMGAAVTLPNWSPILNQMPTALTPLADVRPLKLRDLLGGLADLATQRKEALERLYAVRPDIKNRLLHSDVEQFLAPAMGPRRGLSRIGLVRRLTRLVRKGGRGMIWMDGNTRAAAFLGLCRQFRRERGLTGKALDQAAGDATARFMYRDDTPMHPAYETEIGRWARESTLGAYATPFTQGRASQLNMIYSALDDYHRTGDVKKLTWRLSILGGVMPAWFTLNKFLSPWFILGAIAAGGVGAAYAAQQKRQRGGLAGDFLENAVSPMYGAGEAVRLLRSRQPGAALSSPPLAAIERTGAGLTGLGRAIERSDSRLAARSSLRLIEGLSALGGVPIRTPTLLVQTAAGLAAGTRRGRRAGQGRAAGRRPRTLRELFARRRQAGTKRTPGRAGARPRTIREWLAQAKARRTEVQSSKFKVQS